MGRMLKLSFALTCLAALAAFAIAQLVLGCMGLAQLAGWGGAALGVLLWALLGWRLPLQIGAFAGAMSLWHWPWLPALLFAAPREVLMVPGLLARLIARLRHPPPSWRGVVAGSSGTAQSTATR
jgi:hypothetical protein